MKSRILKLKSKADYVNTRYNELEKELKSLKKSYEKINTIFDIFKEASGYTLKNLITYLENLTRNTCKILFPRQDFQVKFEFVERRGTRQIDIKLYQYGKEVNITDGGGGLIAILNQILQIAFVNLSKNKNMLFADEPLAPLSNDRQALAAKVITDICDDLDMQIIMVSHQKEFIEEVKNVNKIWKTA